MIASLRVAWLLARRQIQNTSRWTTVLVILVMVLTFLMMVVISGVLVGLTEGVVQANRAKTTGDIVITTPAGRNDLSFTNQIIDTLETFPSINGHVVRFLNSGTIEANYRNSRNINQKSDTIGTTITGIIPEQEDTLTKLSNSIVEGKYLSSKETGYVVLGVNLLEEYLENFGNTDFQGLSNINTGDKVIISVNGLSREFIVKGLIEDKAGDISLRAYITKRDFIEISQRTTQNANEIAIFTNTNDVDLIKSQLIRSNIDQEYAVIETWEEAQGKFIEDIKGTFSLLGSVIGGIALIVASITIFIIIFINAISRRKFIGILKGIGIRGQAISLAYIIQSLFYSISGIIIGALLTYGVLVPYFEKNPIDFPFSDGILVALVPDTVLKSVILVIFTIIAGFIPANIIIKKNTLDSILGR